MPGDGIIPGQIFDTAGESAGVRDDVLESDLRTLAGCLPFLSPADRAALIRLAQAMKPVPRDRRHEVRRFHAALGVFF